MQQSHQMSSLLEQIRQDPSLVERMPSQEGEIVRAALDGKSVYEIASDYGTSETNVWHVLGRAAREASGSEMHPVETGGFGSFGSEPDLRRPGEITEGDDTEDRAQSGGTRRNQRPQTPHPSQAEGSDGDEDQRAMTPQTRHPSQAEGDEESAEQ